MRWDCMEMPLPFNNYTIFVSNGNYAEVRRWYGRQLGLIDILLSISSLMCFDCSCETCRTHFSGKHRRQIILLTKGSIWCVVHAIFLHFSSVPCWRMLASVPNTSPNDGDSKWCKRFTSLNGLSRVHLPALLPYGEADDEEYREKPMLKSRSAGARMDTCNDKSYLHCLDATSHHRFISFIISSGMFRGTNNGSTRKVCFQ